MLKKKIFKISGSLVVLFAYMIGAISSGSSEFMQGMYSGATNAYSNPFQPSYNFTLPATPTYDFTLPAGGSTTPVITSAPVVTSTPVSSGSSGSSTSSGKPAQTSTRKCSCKGGWYECPCSNVPTYGTTSYHECSNCGARHMRGSHSCKCKKCGGKGYI